MSSRIDVGAGGERLLELRRPSALRIRSSPGGRRRRARVRSRARRRRPPTRWLSLMSTASSRPKRWFAPPPQRTAYFSRARRPGVVLRVQTIAAWVPATACTSARVAVATPERWPRRLSAVRSPVRIARAGPLIRASVVFAVTTSPSETSRLEPDRRIEQREDPLRHRQAGDRTAAARHQPRAGDAPRGGSSPRW